MVETRKLAAILAADVVGFSRMTRADEDGTLERLRTLRSELIDPTVSANKGRVFKRTGDGVLVEFRSVVDAVRCAINVQKAMIARNASEPHDRRIEFRIGVHLGDVVEESDGDLMGDGVNIAARLEGVAEPGGVSLSSSAYEQVRDKLQETFIDLGEQSLKNIARAMRVYALKPALWDAPAAHSAEPAASPRPRLSIVVLPFGNFGGDPEQAYFVDGVTESLTTDLSRIRVSFVVARNTAFSYKGQRFDVKTIGRELNVCYALEGSVQRSGARMRVNVQLIDAETGNHLWAERFDKPLADLFDMQDEIVARLAGALNTQLAAAEARRAEQTPTPDSMDLYFQGLAWYNKGRTPRPCCAGAQLFRSRAQRRSRQCRRTHWSGAHKRNPGHFFICKRAVVDRSFTFARFQNRRRAVFRYVCRRAAFGLRLSEVAGCATTLLRGGHSTGLAHRISRFTATFCARGLGIGSDACESV